MDFESIDGLSDSDVLRLYEDQVFNDGTTHISACSYYHGAWMRCTERNIWLECGLPSCYGEMCKNNGMGTVVLQGGSYYVYSRPSGYIICGYIP